MNSVYLSIGSNIHRSYVVEAMLWLRERLDDVKSSGIYETPAVHGGPKPYTNAVVCGRTEMDIMALTRLLKHYEQDHGRDAAARTASRVPIDIDVVVWNDEVLRPRDFRHSFFQIGYSELSGPVVEDQTDA